VSKNYINKKWEASENYLIGGWWIRSTPMASEKLKEEEIVADMMAEMTAKHIVGLHNRWLVEISPRPLVDSSHESNEED